MEGASILLRNIAKWRSLRLDGPDKLYAQFGCRACKSLAGICLGEI